MELAREAVRNMKVGWNLGNSLDSCGLGNVSETKASVSEYETQWGNPVTKRHLIETLKKCGYDAIRIPVTYFEHMDEDGKIESNWLARVKELTDMVLEQDMYCIINVHHDVGAGEQAWLRADREIYEKQHDKFVRIWEQIAEIFKDYGEKLLFEGFNEMLDAHSQWDYTDAEGYECINQYNQLFVDTVRKSGGKNDSRNLVLNTYGASPMVPAAQHFVLPKDVERGHLIAEVHFYKPDGFSAGDTEVFDEDGKQEVEQFIERMKTNFLDKEIPVILGESGTHDIRSEEERTRYAQYVITQTVRNGMSYFWWDDGGSMRIIDRTTGDVVYKKLQKAIVDTASQVSREN